MADEKVNPPKEDALEKIRRQVHARVKAEAGNSVDKQTGGTPSGTRAGLTTEFVLECLDANELGDGVLFATLHDGEFVLNKAADRWLRWAEHHWELDYKDTVKDAVENIAGEYVKAGAELAKRLDWAVRKNDKEAANALQVKQRQAYRRVSRLRSERGRMNCLKFAANNPLKPIRIVGDELDRKPWHLACRNGVIDLRTGDVSDGRPEDYLMKASPVEWQGIDASAPAWEKTLDEIFNGDKELIQYIGRLFGYGITGLVREAVLPVLHGQGRNGKTTLIEAISHVLGPDLARPIHGEMLLSQGHSRNPGAPSPDIMSLRGARLVFASETDQNRAFSVARVKLLTGGDTLVGRSPHDKFEIAFQPSHLLILSTNHIPHATAQDFAFWERVHLIPFRLSFVDRDPQKENERRADKTLGDRLKAEAPGILAWLVRGCIEWQQKGLAPPAEVRKETLQQQRSEDLLADFLEACCYIARDEKVSAADLYDAYADWHKENVSSNPMKAQKFGRILREKGFKKRKSGRLYYMGLRLLE